MQSSILAFSRHGTEYRWFEMLDDSLIESQIFSGDIVECHLEQTLDTLFPYVILVCGYLLVRYVHEQESGVVLIPACTDMPIIFTDPADVDVIGRVVRVFHCGEWWNINSPGEDFWLKWAIQEAS